MGRPTRSRFLARSSVHLNGKPCKQLFSLVENGESIPISNFPKNPCVRAKPEKFATGCFYRTSESCSGCCRTGAMGARGRRIGLRGEDSRVETRRI
jgi:hypothetical protein